MRSLSKSWAFWGKCSFNSTQGCSYINTMLDTRQIGFDFSAVRSALTGDIFIAAVELGSTSLQEIQEGDDISSGYDCTQRFHPRAPSFIFVCVCVCVVAVALPPEKTNSCCVEDKMQERDGQSTAGKQLQFEVSAYDTLTSTRTHARSFANEPCCVSGAGVCRVCGGGQQTGMDFHPLWFWQQWQSYKRGNNF